MKTKKIFGRYLVEHGGKWDEHIKNIWKKLQWKAKKVCEIQKKKLLNESTAKCTEKMYVKIPQKFKKNVKILSQKSKNKNSSFLVF